LRAIIRRAISVARKYAPLRLALMTASPVRLGLIGRELLNRDAGAVDQDGERAERGLRGIECLADRSDIRDVHLHGGCAAALASEFLFERFEFCGLARRQHHGSAMRGQDACELPPQPLACAGDEDDFFTKVE
jgi:hypothetical protein